MTIINPVMLLWRTEKCINFAEKLNMIKVKFSSKGLECDQHISVGTFAPNGNAIVRVVCEKKCYQEERAFEDSICSLLSRLLPDGYKVTTHHVALNSSTGEDMSGKYIEQLDFQVFIENED